MRYVYRRKISGNEKIVADRQYSFVFALSTELSEERLKEALDLTVGRLTSEYPLKLVTYMLWKKPAYPSIEILFTWRESPGATLYWFSDRIERLAAEYYVTLDLQEVAIFLPFPWWMILLIVGIGSVAVGAAIKEKKKK